MELNNIPSEGRFGMIANKINGNFETIRVKIGDVVYATRKNKGLFADAAALSAAIPSPLVGDWALVGNAFPADVYVCTTAGTWTDSGNDYSGDTIDLTDYVEKDDYDAFKDAVNERLGEIGDFNVSDTITPVSGAAYPWTFFYIGEVNIGDEIIYEVTTSSTMHWSVGTRIKSGNTFTNLDGTARLIGNNSGSFVVEHNATHAGFRVWEEQVTDTTPFEIRFRIIRVKNMPENSIKEHFINDGAVTTPKIKNNAVTTPKIADGSVTAVKGDYSIANWQLLSSIIPDINTTTGYINFGQADGADIYIASQKGILWLNHKSDGENYDHPNLIHDGKIECPFKLGTTDTRSAISVLFLDTINYTWVVRDLYCWDRAQETIKASYPTEGLILIGTVVTTYSETGEYVAGGFKRGYFPFDFTVDGKQQGAGEEVKPDKADYSLVNWQLMSTVVPNVETATGYINFGDANGADIYI